MDNNIETNNNNTITTTKTDNNIIHLINNDEERFVFVWSHKDSFAGQIWGEEIALAGWNFTMGSPLRIVILCLFTGFNYVLVFLGLFQVGSGALTLIGTVLESIIIWGTFPFMTSRQANWIVIKQGDVLLYDSLALTGGFCLAHVMGWDLRTSFVVLLFTIVHSSAIADAYHPEFVRFAPPFSFFTAVLFVAIMCCMSLGVFPNVNDQIFDFGTLGGIAIRTQTYSVLQFGISCFATLGIFATKNGINIMVNIQKNLP
jgi:hypothetical protein